MGVTRGEEVGRSSKLGRMVVFGVGDGEVSGNFTTPVARRIIKPIAPIMMTATRPETSDFIAYIIR